MSKTRIAIAWIVALKHLQGQHNQKRHGWRYGTTQGARRGLSGDIDYGSGQPHLDNGDYLHPKGERGEYRYRSYIKSGISEDDALHRVIQKEERKIRQNDFETLIVYGGDGKPLLHKPGGYDHVSISDDDERKISQKDAIITHNHPLGLEHPLSSPHSLGNSFSVDDINVAILLNAKEMRAITAYGDTYVMKRPKNGWVKPQIFQNIVERTRSEMNAWATEQIKVGKITQEDIPNLNAGYQHDLMTRLAAKFGAEYYKIPASGAHKRSKDYVYQD